MVQHPYPHGRNGVASAEAELASRLPDELTGLARLAYNIRWSWTPGAQEAFRRLAPARWEATRENPVRLLTETSPADRRRAADDRELVERIAALEDELDAELARPFADLGDGAPPVAFFCAEFGLHRSLPMYSGGLGVLAGDILKEASDRALPYVGVGLFYRRGYFHQRLDRSGWQHEYWVEADPDLWPMGLVRDDDGHPVTVEVPIRDRRVVAQVWRLDVGRVPLFLLDTDRPENRHVDRFITARLYEGNRDLRLAQYTLLGLGGVRALRAVGIEPGTVHLNEGHAALAALELARQADGAALAERLAAVRERVVFTTHTPVAAGNESYPGGQVATVLAGVADELGAGVDDVLALGRIDPGDPGGEVGMTPLAIRTARSINGVSERHGEVARRMWSSLPAGPRSIAPIRHVTNGVHLPTWMAAPMREVLDRHLEDGWWRRADDPAVWKPVADIPDAELWEARCASRRALIERARQRSASDRLMRGEDLGYSEAASHHLDEDALTVGFARRLAAYKRLYLLAADPGRVTGLMDGPRSIQVLVAGKAHPQDDAAKSILQGVFRLRESEVAPERAVFLEDYDMALGAELTAGCDVWINVPRPPLEASGTSGMKSALNGGLNLSVLDGWWAEAYDGSNGWAIGGEEADDHGAQDQRHAHQLYDLLEQEVVPLFHDRDADGVPGGWVARMKAALMTIGPRFCASRMMADYERDVYRTG